jgi:type II secretory pathway component PulC
MNRAHRTVRALAAPAFLLLACAGAWASDDDEHKITESSQVNAESPAGLPFVVAGTMTAPPTKFAVISMIGPEGKAGAQMLASEGAAVAAYRVVSIHPDRVVFEREGRTFFVRVGTERQDELTPTPTTPYVRKRSAPLTVVAPPANIEEIRQQTGAFLERLKANPEFQKRVAAMLRRVREREGASQPPTRP